MQYCSVHYHPARLSRRSSRYSRLTTTLPRPPRPPLLSSLPHTQLKVLSLPYSITVHSSFAHLLLSRVHVLGRRVAITWLPRPALARGFTSRFTSSLPPPLPSSSSSLPQQHHKHKHKHNTTSPPPSTRLSHRPRVAALLNRHSLLLLPSLPGCRARSAASIPFTQPDSRPITQS